MDKGEARNLTLDDLVKQLSPSDQRLVRELVFKLAGLPPQEPPAVEKTQPQDLRGYVESWASRLRLEGKRPSTIKAYTDRVKALLRYNPSPTPGDIEAFLVELGKRSRPAVVGNTIFAINSFFGHLRRKGIVESNPLGDLKAPSVPLRVRNCPTTEQIARLLNSPTVTVKDQALIITFTACGLRAAELLGCRRSDVDLGGRKITVVGKGDRQRNVPMTAQVVCALKQHLDCCASSQWLFPGKNPEKPYAQSSLNDRFAVLCDRAGIDRVVPHQLRHFFASALLNAGVNVKDVSMLMGHANPSVTSRVYWHVIDEDQRVRAYQEHDPLQQINFYVAGLRERQSVRLPRKSVQNRIVGPRF